jgi:hypothetical protein
VVVLVLHDGANCRGLQRAHASVIANDCIGLNQFTNSGRELSWTGSEGAFKGLAWRPAL